MVNVILIWFTVNNYWNILDNGQCYSLQRLTIYWKYWIFMVNVILIWLTVNNAIGNIGYLWSMLF